MPAPGDASVRIGQRPSQRVAVYRFGGSIDAYPEGEVFVPGSPVATVSGCFGEGLLLETLVLSVLNHDSAVASAAARMVLAAGGRPLPQPVRELMRRVSKLMKFGAYRF